MSPPSEAPLSPPLPRRRLPRIGSADSINAQTRIQPGIDTLIAAKAAIMSRDLDQMTDYAADQWRGLDRPAATLHAAIGSPPDAAGQELLWAILENLSEGVVACDARGTLSFFNRATREFHGIEEKEIGPAEWSEQYALHRADGTPMTTEEVPLYRALHGEIVRNTVLVIAPPNQEPRTVICNGRPLHDRLGNLLGAFVVMRDVTEQLAAERQKADLVRERELNLAKDEVLATVAHELRSPLTAVLGWTQMLQLRDEEARRALAAIEESTRMQAQLIEDLTDVASISAGKFTLNRERLYVHDILKSAIVGSRPAAEVKGVTLIPPPSYEPAMVEGDRVRLQQVFWNLLTNALKFTPSGGTISIRMEVRHDHVRVDVRDTGRGIDAEFLPRVFERYSQADSRKSEQRGLGLGLAIARTIVELHGGRITVTSEGEGKGAAFSVTLPLVTAE